MKVYELNDYLTDLCHLGLAQEEIVVEKSDTLFSDILEPQYPTSHYEIQSVRNQNDKLAICIA